MLVTELFARSRRDAALRELAKRNIEIRQYNDCLALSYGPRAKKNDSLACECRSLLLSPDGLSVFSRSFPRFFNYGEMPGKFDFSGTQVFEKIDGSLCVLYFHPAREKWEFRTRRTAFGEYKVDGANVTFGNLAAKAAKTLDFPNLDKNFSYVFELVSPESKIITPYNECALYYLASFDNRDGSEQEYQPGLEYVSRHLKCRALRTFAFQDIGQIIEMAKNLPAVEEGYVIRNCRGERIKIKNPAYVALALLNSKGSFTGKRILELIESGDDSEVLAYFPEQRKKFESVARARTDFIAETENIYQKIKDIEGQKEFAIAALKFPQAPLLFQMRKGMSAKKAWENAGNKKSELLKID